METKTDNKQVQSGYIYGHAYFWAQVGDETRRFYTKDHGSIDAARQAMRAWIATFSS